MNEFNINCDLALKNSWHEKLRKGFRFTLKELWKLFEYHWLLCSPKVVNGEAYRRGLKNV